MKTQLAWLGLAGGVLGLALGLPTEGSATSVPALKAAAQADLVQTVGYYKKRRYYRNYYDHHVRAPFTSVDSGRATHVEAPFTTVHTNRYGTYVRAPFVDLWVPR